MLFLFNAYTDHSSQSSPVPWTGKTLSNKKGQMDGMSDMDMFVQNQSILIHYCMKQRRDVAIKFFGKPGEGWPIGKLDPIWAQCSRFFRQLSKGGIISSHRKCVIMNGNKPVESMWIHHYVILQMIHSKFVKFPNPQFHHDNHSSFITEIDSNAYFEKNNTIPNYKYVWGQGELS